MTKRHDILRLTTTILPLFVQQRASLVNASSNVSNAVYDLRCVMLILDSTSTLLRLCVPLVYPRSIIPSYRNSIPTPTPKPRAVLSPFRPIKGIEKLTSILIGSSLAVSSRSKRSSMTRTDTSSLIPRIRWATYTSLPRCPQKVDLNVNPTTGLKLTPIIACHLA